MYAIYYCVPLGKLSSTLVLFKTGLALQHGVWENFGNFIGEGGLTLGVDFTKSSKEGVHTTKPFL